MASANGVVASSSPGEGRTGATDYCPALQQQQQQQQQQQCSSEAAAAVQQQQQKPPKRGAAAAATTQQQIKGLHTVYTVKTIKIVGKKRRKKIMV